MRSRIQQKKEVSEAAYLTKKGNLCILFYVANVGT